jgi:hypothetical protein
MPDKQKLWWQCHSFDKLDYLAISTQRSQGHGVSLTKDLTNLSRGGGYECDEYCLETIHCMTLYKYSLLNRAVLFHRKDAQGGYVTTAN